MKYAVIAISGSQYHVEEVQTINVDNHGLEDKKTASTDQVLLLVDDDKTKIGQPLVKNAIVKYQVIKNYKGKKLRIFKYKAKSRYRRTMGFRHQLTDIKITKISIKKATKPKKTTPSKASK